MDLIAYKFIRYKPLKLLNYLYNEDIRALIGIKKIFMPKMIVFDNNSDACFDSMKMTNQTC